ncbi:MAG: Nif3-like dinuclear metal center hexameric protein, partial [Anaerolineae bacterium]
MNRDELVAYLDDYLQVSAIEDKSNNGLQVEGTDDVTRLAFAVDAGLAAFEAAAKAATQMLIVHHGLFWSKPVMLTGIHRRRVQQLLEADLSLYAVHLPLDFHNKVGNNATLACWLHLEEAVPFGEYKGHSAGVAGTLPQTIPLDRFTARVEEALGQPVIGVWPFGSQA